MGERLISRARNLAIAGVLTVGLAFCFTMAGMAAPAVSETGSSWGIEKAYAARYTLSEKSLTLDVGDYWTISVNETTKAEDKKVKWSSSNTRVAKVKRTKDTNGTYVCKITAVGSGTCTVKALVKGKTCKCKVKVNKVVYKADKENVTVEVGETAKVTITFTGSGTVTFNRSNTNVAEASWSSKNWKNNTTELYIKGLKPGTMSLLMTNSLTSDSFSINVRVQGTDISTVMNAVDSNYTFTNSSGKHGIKRIDYVGDTEYSYAVLSDRASNQLSFITVYENYANNTKGSVAMDVRGTEDGYVTIEVIDSDLKYHYAFKGTASFQKSAYYKNKSLNWAITESDYYGSEMTELNKKIANNIVSMAMLGWSKVLGDYTGYSLADLGFTSYQP